MFEHGFPSHWSTIKKLIWLKGAGIIGGASAVWKTVTGTLIHITDAIASPVKELSIAVNSTTGVSECNINHYGKNLWNPSTSVAGYIDRRNGRIASQTTPALEYTTDFIEIPTGTTFLSFGYDAFGDDIADRWASVSLYDDGKTFITRLVISDWASATSGIGKYNISSYATAKYARFSSRTYGHGLQYLYATFGEDTDFAFYNSSSTTYTISWQTEAGSITSGTLTIAEDGSVSLESGGDTHQLESITPITLLAGENNVWTDCGDTTVIYLANGNSGGE